MCILNPLLPEVVFLGAPQRLPKPLPLYDILYGAPRQEQAKVGLRGTQGHLVSINCILNDLG